MCTGDKYRGVPHDRHFRPTHDFTLLVKLIVCEEIWIWLMLEPFSMGSFHSDNSFSDSGSGRAQRNLLNQQRPAMIAVCSSAGASNG
jgi:hypothetical protein